MSNIDFSQLITAADRTAQAAAQRADAIKACCGEIIEETADRAARENILARAIIGDLSMEEEKAHCDLRAWIQLMQEECRRAVAEGDDPLWPKAPDNLVALVQDH